MDNEQTVPDAAAPATSSSGGALRKAFGVPLILLGLYLLSIGGAMFGPSVALTLLGKPLNPGLLVGALLFGALGGGSLYGGVWLCRDRGGAEGPVVPWRVLAFGLLFPGAAQAYGGRWLVCGLFLLIPWLLTAATLVAAMLWGVATSHMGLSPSVAFFDLLARVLRPGKAIYALLWVGSLVEGWRWAGALPEGRPPRPIPRWPAPVFILGTIAYSFVFFLMFAGIFIGGVLKVGQALRAAPAPAVSAAPVPGVAASAPMPEAAPNGGSAAPLP